jgi:hypothetical protein
MITELDRKMRYLIHYENYVFWSTELEMFGVAILMATGHSELGWILFGISVLGVLTSAFRVAKLRKEAGVE